jgi:hypothetical protein
VAQESLASEQWQNIKLTAEEALADSETVLRLGACRLPR